MRKERWRRLRWRRDLIDCVRSDVEMLRIRIVFDASCNTGCDCAMRTLAALQTEPHNVCIQTMSDGTTRIHFVCVTRYCHTRHAYAETCCDDDDGGGEDDMHAYDC